MGAGCSVRRRHAASAREFGPPGLIAAPLAACEREQTDAYLPVTRRNTLGCAALGLGRCCAPAA